MEKHYATVCLPVHQLSMTLSFIKTYPIILIFSYDAEISQADYEYVKVFEAHGGDLNEFPGAILARLTIFFKEAQFITSKRSELYGLTDFMANVGGLLGKNR
jgi:amiloride-sensitive sodium channel